MVGPTGPVGDDTTNLALAAHYGCHCTGPASLMKEDRKADLFCSFCQSDVDLQDPENVVLTTCCQAFTHKDCYDGWLLSGRLSCTACAGVLTNLGAAPGQADQADEQDDFGFPIPALDALAPGHVVNHGDNGYDFLLNDPHGTFIQGFWIEQSFANGDPMTEYGVDRWETVAGETVLDVIKRLCKWQVLYKINFRYQGVALNVDVHTVFADLFHDRAPNDVYIEIVTLANEDPLDYYDPVPDDRYFQKYDIQVYNGTVFGVLGYVCVYDLFSMQELDEIPDYPCLVEFPNGERRRLHDVRHSTVHDLFLGFGGFKVIVIEGPYQQ